MDNERWEDIADLIDRWKRKNPEGYKQNMDYVAAVKEELKDDKHAEWKADDKGTGMRLGLMIHPELMTFIEHFHPEFMKSNKDVKEFGRRFNNFQIPQKI
jgi:hypothetical protein